MVTPPPTGDPARAALNLSDEILSRLEAATAPQAESAPFRESGELSMNDQLDALEPLMDAAVDSGNEPEVRKLIQQGKDVIRAERAEQQKLLEDAQDYFSEALKEYGEAGEQTQQAAAEVERLKKTVANFDTFVMEQDAYYDAVLANMHATDSVPAPETASKPEPQERAKSLAELLQALESAESAYRARLEEIKAEKQDIAQRIIDERVAALKQQITS